MKIQPCKLNLSFRSNLHIIRIRNEFISFINFPYKNAIPGIKLQINISYYILNIIDNTIKYIKLSYA